MKRLSYLAGVLILFTACAPVYIPNQVQTPMLREKGEATASLSLGVSAFDMQAAISPAQNIDLIAATSFLNGEDNNHFFLEGGLGYYQALGEMAQFELLGALGFGKSEATYASEGVFSDYNTGSYTRVYLQPNLNLITKNFETSLGFRTAYVSSKKLGTGLFAEPVLTVRFGLENLKFQIQGGFSLNMVDNIHLDYEPLIFNVGLVYTFHKPKLQN